MRSSIKHCGILLTCLLLNACMTEQVQPDKPPAQAARVPGGVLLEQANAAYRTGNFTEAVTKLEQLVVMYPKIPHIWFKLGNANAKLHRYDNSASAYQHAIAIDPHYVKASYNLGMIRLIQSADALEQAKKYAPSDSAAAIQTDEILNYSKRLLALLARDSNKSIQAAGEQKLIDANDASETKAENIEINRQGNEVPDSH